MKFRNSRFLLEENDETAEEAELLEAYRRLRTPKFRRAAIRSLIALAELQD